nr:uncharacterized protein LOC109167542 [Ipomoea batatas]
MRKSETLTLNSVCSTARDEKGQCANENVGDHRAEEAKSIPVQPDHSPPKTNRLGGCQVQERAQDYKDNYGSWMPVVRRRRGGQRREGEGESEPPPITNNRVMPNLNTEVSLPRIRTNQNPQGGTEKWPRNRSPNMNVWFISQSQGSAQGTTRGKGNRRGVPRRAAVETEHIVIRGSNRGKQIISTVVCHEPPKSSHRAEQDYGFKEVPPDIARIFTEPQDDEAMADVDLNGPDGPVMEDRLRY